MLMVIYSQSLISSHSRRLPPRKCFYEDSIIALAFCSPIMHHSHPDRAPPWAGITAPLCVTFSPLLIVLIAGETNKAAGAPLSPG